MRGFVSAHRSRWVVVLGALALSLSFVGIVAAGRGGLDFTPRSADQITNIDILRQQIKNYYGTPTAKTGATACDPNLVPPADGNYAREASKVAQDGGRWLNARAHHLHRSTKPAIVLDVDDTTLATWNYELCSNWAYDPVSNGNFVNGQLFPAVPGMVDMVNRAAKQGYAIFFLTGRPASQEAATLGNLTHDGIAIDAGYPAPTDLGNGEDGLFTKPPVGSYPDYLNKAEFCGPSITAGTSCPTILYKSGVRAHIEAMGFDIVGNFGDQYSDLQGGFADRTFKLPNPNYYLP